MLNALVEKKLTSSSHLLNWALIWADMAGITFCITIEPLILLYMVTKFTVDSSERASHPTVYKNHERIDDMVPILSVSVMQ